MQANQLLQETTELALHLIEKNGTFLPFFRCVNSLSESFIYTVESDTEFTVDQAAETVRKSVQRDLEVRQLVGIAFCDHRRIRLSDSEELVATVRVVLHYLGLSAMEYHFPYRDDQGSLQLMKYLSNNSSDDLFNGR